MRSGIVAILLLGACLDISPETQPLGAGPPPPPPPPGPTVSFQQDLVPLFMDTCTICHGSAGGLSLEGFASVMFGGNSGAVVIPGDSDASILWIRVDGNTLGDQMPLGQRALTTFERNLIRTWIDEGALDN